MNANLRPILRRGQAGTIPLALAIEDEGQFLSLIEPYLLSNKVRFKRNAELEQVEEIETYSSVLWERRRSPLATSIDSPASTLLPNMNKETGGDSIADDIGTVANLDANEGTEQVVVQPKSCRRAWRKKEYQQMRQRETERIANGGLRDYDDDEIVWKNTQTNSGMIIQDLVECNEDSSDDSEGPTTPSEERLAAMVEPDLPETEVPRDVACSPRKKSCQSKASNWQMWQVAEANNIVCDGF